MDSRSLGNDSGSFANGTTTNALEPMQAYVAWRHDASTFRVGRVTQDLGKRRLRRAQPLSQHRQQLHRCRLVVDGRRRPRRARVLLGADAAAAERTRQRARQRVRARPRVCADSSITGFFYQFPAFADQHRLEAYVFDAKAEAPSDPSIAVRPRHARRARLSSAASGRSGTTRSRPRCRTATRAAPSPAWHAAISTTRRPSALRDRLPVRRAWVAEPDVPVRPRDRRRGPGRRDTSTASTRCSARAASTSGPRASTASSRAATSTRRACG